MNLKFTVSYDGTSFLGWQKTKMGPSVEESLEKALTILLGHTVRLQAASRTDAGVHAEEQIVNCITSSSITPFRLMRGLQGLLPKEIVVTNISVVPESFHPTLDCSGKEYRYSICNSLVQIPFFRNTSWHVRQPINTEEMRKAASFFLGEHDFSAFTSEKKEIESETTYIRKIFSIEIEELSLSRLSIAIQGNRFLYKMVRTIVGTLVYVGIGKIQASEIPLILESRDRTKAGVTAPAHGLCLTRVFYQDEPTK